MPESAHRRSPCLRANVLGKPGSKGFLRFPIGSLKLNLRPQAQSLGQRLLRGGSPEFSSRAELRQPDLLSKANLALTNRRHSTLTQQILITESHKSKPLLPRFLQYICSTNGLVLTMSMDIDTPVALPSRPLIPQDSATYVCPAWLFVLVLTISQDLVL